MRSLCRGTSGRYRRCASAGRRVSFAKTRPCPHESLKFDRAAVNTRRHAGPIRRAEPRATAVSLRKVGYPSGEESHPGLAIK